MHIGSLAPSGTKSCSRDGCDLMQTRNTAWLFKEAAVQDTKHEVSYLATTVALVLMKINAS